MLIVLFSFCETYCIQQYHCIILMYLAFLFFCQHLCSGSYVIPLDKTKYINKPEGRQLFLSSLISLFYMLNHHHHQSITAVENISLYPRFEHQQALGKQSKNGKKFSGKMCKVLSIYMVLQKYHPGCIKQNIAIETCEVILPHSVFESSWLGT